MNQDYLTPFLKKANLHIPSYDLPLGPLVKDLPITGGLGESLKKIYKTDDKQGLANMITDAITSALKKSDQYVQDKQKKIGKIQADIKKIKGISMPNAINLYYGGGLLVFGPDFNIKQMIHMFYDDKTKPVYFSNEISDSMEDDVINKNLTTSKPYASANIIQEIKDVIGETI